MSEEVNYLECSVCFKGYNDTPKQTPRSLYCGHTFCTYCLEQLATNNTITCPTCRQKHTLSEGVRECNKNFALLELLGKLKSPEVLCADCEEERATVWCPDCTWSYCGKCNKNIHKHKLFRGHKRVKLEEKPVNITCAEHEERYHFFCQDCIVPVCYICKDRDHGKHGGHTTQLLLNAESDKRELLEDRRSKLEEAAKTLESKSQKVVETSKLVVDNQAKHSREIQESTKALIEEINKRSLELISEIKHMASEKTESLQTYRAELGASFAAATALIEESKQLLNCDRLKLLLDVKELVAKMDKSITSVTECSLKPITSSYIGCALDKTGAIDAVKRFGGIGVPNIPENLKTSTITSTSAEISWNPSSLSSVPQDSFVIQYCEKEEKTADWKDLTMSKDKTKTLITNFQPKTSYSVRICAANHVGRGQWTEEIKFQTKPTPPSPESLTCANVTAVSAEVKWNPPKLNKLGPGDSYVVQYGEDEEGKGDLKDIKVSQQKTSVILENLKPNTSHSVRVCASNKFGRGNWTSHSKFKTRFPKPLVTVSNASWNSADISWKLQNSSDFSYDIQYGEEAKNAGLKNLAISKGITTTTVEGLSERSSYSLCVRAVISKTTGEWSSYITFRTIGTKLLDGTSGAKLQEFLGDLKKGELLYKASLHGFAASVFHQRCDKKGPTLTVIKRNGSSTIYGGYTPLNWESSGNWKKDDQLRSFVFTMSDDNGNPTKFQQQDPEYAIYCTGSNGPTIGGGFTIYICNNSNTTAGSHTNTYTTYAVPTQTTLCGQYNNYTIDDIEVFSVH